MFNPSRSKFLSLNSKEGSIAETPHQDLSGVAETLLITLYLEMIQALTTHGTDRVYKKPRIAHSWMNQDA
jgi:hypothetical protein